jgi:hypothetical protein
MAMRLGAVGCLAQFDRSVWEPLHRVLPAILGDLGRTGTPDCAVGSDGRRPSHPGWARTERRDRVPWQGANPPLLP